MAEQDEHEKGALKSKKFVAYLVLELGFFVLMGMMIYEQEMDKLGENLAFMILAVTAGFVGTGYILGQASLDRFVRVAKITMGRGDDSSSSEGDEQARGRK